MSEVLNLQPCLVGVNDDKYLCFWSSMAPFLYLVAFFWLLLEKEIWKTEESKSKFLPHILPNMSIVGIWQHWSVVVHHDSIIRTVLPLGESATSPEDKTAKT